MGIRAWSAAGVFFCFTSRVDLNADALPMEMALATGRWTAGRWTEASGASVFPSTPALGSSGASSRALAVASVEIREERELSYVLKIYAGRKRAGRVLAYQTLWPRQGEA